MAAEDFYEEAIKLIDSGKYYEAIPILRKAIASKPHTGKYHYWLATCFYLLTDYIEAEKYNRRALDLEPNWSKPYCGIGACYRMLGNYDDAEKYLHIAIDLEPNWTRPYWHLAECFRGQYKFDEAIRWYKLVIDMNPAGWEIAHTYNGLGYCFLNQANYKEAKEYFLISIDLENEWETPVTGIGECLRLQGYNTEAEKYYEKAIQLNPDSWVAYDGMGECLRFDGLFIGAKNNYVTAISKNPSYPYPYLHLYELPRETFEDYEPLGFPYLNKFILLANPYEILKNFSRLLQIIVKNEGVTLIDYIFEKAGKEIDGELYSNYDFLEAIQLGNQFRQQFLLWDNQKDRSPNSYVVEAILHHFLGNSIKSFEIFSTKVKQIFSKQLPLFTYYYFALSACMIISEEKDDIINAAVNIAERSLKNKTVSASVQYYAALIFALAGKVDEALHHLSKTANDGFEPSIYQHADLLKSKFISDQDYENEVINELYIKHDPACLTSPFLYPGKIILCDDADKILLDLEPMLYFMENRNFMSEIVTFKPENSVIDLDEIFRKRYFFANHIFFENMIDDDKKYNYLKQNNPDIFKEIYGREIDINIINAEIEKFEKINNGAYSILRKVGREIHSSTFTYYVYTKQNLKGAPDRPNYNFYILLITNLVTAKLITKTDALILHEYIKYCVFKICNMIKEDDLNDVVIDQIKDTIINVEQYIGIGYTRIEQLIKIASEKIKGKNSEIISFDDFHSSLTITQSE